MAHTHRVAISNSRLVAIDPEGVTFRVEDYRRSGDARLRTMTLAPGEFMRRFLLHILPSGFHRIRHYGLLASASRKATLERIRTLLVPAATTTTADTEPVGDTTAEATPHRPSCPCCGGRMIVVETFERGQPPRGPPRARP